MVTYPPRTRRFERAPQPDELDLGPLQQLPGLWKNIGDPTDAGNQGQRTFGRGWNLIALPFARDDGLPPFRLLMNQYHEELRFTFVDDDVPNRGLRVPDEDKADQMVVTIDYQQTIRQIIAEDDAGTTLAGPAQLPIHHEPGLFLHMKNRRTDGLNIARLATIPHGNAATLLGTFREYDGPPQNIDSASSFPEGVVPVGTDIAAAVAAASEDTPYLLPYKHFTDKPFRGIFSAKTPFDTFKAAISAFTVTHTTELPLTTELDEAGIRNIPFIERQADANLMRSTFYIMQLEEKDAHGRPKYALAYTQFLFLDFFRRFDGEEGLIRWPHISINVLERAAVPEEDDPYMSKESSY